MRTEERVRVDNSTWICEGRTDANYEKINVFFSSICLLLCPRYSYIRGAKPPFQFGCFYPNSPSLVFPWKLMRDFLV